MANERTTITVRVDKVVAEGDGLGRLPDGRVVFVEGALPGESVHIEIVKQSRDYARARVVEVIEANPARTTPPCPNVVRGCGGCDLQHATPQLQREIKVAIVRESLERLGRIDEPVVRLAPVDLPDERFRTTVRLAAASDGRVGFRRRRSHDVVVVDSCLVAHPTIDRVLSSIRLDGADEVMVRVSVGDGTAVAWAEPDVVDGLDSSVGRGPGAGIEEVVRGTRLRVSAASFFQSSPEAAAALVERVTVALGDPAQWSEGPLVDAYGGIGLFAATIDTGGRAVVVVEANPAACADARHNLAHRSARVVESTVEQWTPERAAAVVADPARDGLRAAGVATLVATGAPVIALVSCDPASLGRDARLLVDAGYDLEWCEVIDAFPHTHHVEAVSRFVRRGRMGS